MYEEAFRRREELELIISEKEKAMRKYPEGKIHVLRRKGNVQYYLRANSKEIGGKYISKKKKETIKTYLQKQYDETILKLLKKEVLRIDAFLNNTQDIQSLIQDTYSQKENEIKEMIIPVDMSDEDYINRWKNIPFQRKSLTDNQKMYLTNLGEEVRSKSELIIANTLQKYGIPYKYESPIVFQSGIRIYPDFTVLNTKTRKETYWEHRGMMDDRDYSRHSVQRIKEYQRNGIYVGERLIITEETSQNPLGTRDIEGIIEHFFVN